MGVNQGGDNYSLTYIPTGLQMVSFGGEEICKVNGGPFPWESGETGAHFEIVEADGFEGGYHIRNVWIAGEKEEGQLYCWSRGMDSKCSSMAAQSHGKTAQ